MYTTNGFPGGLSAEASQGLSAYFDGLIGNQPVTPCITVSDADAAYYAPYVPSDSEFNRIAQLKPIPNITVNAVFGGRPATVTFVPTVFQTGSFSAGFAPGVFYPVSEARVQLRNPEGWFADSVIIMTICAGIYPYSIFPEASLAAAPQLIIQQKSNLLYNGQILGLCEWTSYLFYLVQRMFECRPIVDIYRERRPASMNYSACSPEQQPFYQRQPAQAQTILASFHDINPEPVAPQGEHEIHNLRWQVAGYYRTLSDGRKVWVRSHERGKCKYDESVPLNATAYSTLDP